MKRRHKVQKLLLVSVLLLGLADCKDESTNPGGGNQNNNQPHTISMASMVFSPNSLTIPKGTTVTWQNNDAIPHTATSDSSTWDTGNIPAGTSKSVVFNTAGTYPYNCIYHVSMGMTGTIIVQ